ncbi:hypothetical protein [Brucella grignonensis]|uniref:Uncharacterized protein n=1 Tax=Brucella grignonensis TaxID=94627 RepID=A0A256F0I9_9HYPH|nr:hypothetical protein [Brucella grignonensis]OYR08374.1 hypothetical protein CEV33_3333 [Brucella grignonensis]
MQLELSEKEEQEAKDAFFERISQISQEMVVAYGRDFAMGALVLGARWIAEGRVDQTTKTTPLKE